MTAISSMTDRHDRSLRVFTGGEARNREKDPGAIQFASTFVVSHVFLRRVDFIGEPGRIRTSDPLIKSQLLYQLSYGPA